MFKSLHFLLFHSAVQWCDLLCYYDYSNLFIMIFSFHKIVKSLCCWVTVVWCTDSLMQVTAWNLENGECSLLSTDTKISGSSSAELIHLGLQHFCLSCCSDSTPIAHITALDNNVSAHQVLWSSYTFFHLAQKLFEPDGRKRLSFIRGGMNVHWYLVYNSFHWGLLQSQTWQNWKAKTLLSTDLVHKTDQQLLVQGTARQETCMQENSITVAERENNLGARDRFVR